MDSSCVGEYIAERARAKGIAEVIYLLMSHRNMTFDEAVLKIGFMPGKTEIYSPYVEAFSVQNGGDVNNNLQKDEPGTPGEFLKEKTKSGGWKMSDPVEDIVAMAEAKAKASASEIGFVGIRKQRFIQRLVAGSVENFLETHFTLLSYLETNIKLLHYVIENYGKTYEEAALHLELSPTETELCQPLFQAYESDQELYETLMDKAVFSLLRRKEGEKQYAEK